MVGLALCAGHLAVAGSLGRMYVARQAAATAAVKAEEEQALHKL